MVKKRKMLKDERGQMGIDFIAGLSLFMLTLLFLVHFIPGMFVPFQSETIDLSSVSYRTSVILVEDPGWWDNGTGTDYGEDWEKANHIDNVSRVGLAIDKEHPNMLNMSKINAFNDSTLDLTDKLGLYRNISGNRLNYGYNITLRGLNGTIMAARGETPPEYGDVSSMKRVVSVSTLRYGFIPGGNLTGTGTPKKALIKINRTDVPSFTSQNVTITITDFNITGVNPAYLTTKVGNDTHWTAGGLKITSPKQLVGTSDGYVSINHGDKYAIETNMPINSPNDILEIIIKKEAWGNHGIDTTGSDDIFIEINFRKINVEPVFDEDDALDFNSTRTYVPKPAILIVKVWT